MILAPFKWIVALFFNWSFSVFHDPGWAVVGMSVLLSLLLTPLYIWIERRKNSDKVKSAPMQAEIDKIEAVYSGRERFYYTREIQRRYHYSPWTAMIPTLGLLVQIPFLLTAYHYLSELPVFNGAAFWYIKDLSKPDTIATIAGLPINLLAILMTVINLVSGWRYAESGKPKERIQYMAVAAIFLVLLYNCVASVVLYWTLSNALSLVRSEVFFRKKGATAKSKDARIGVDGDVVAVWLVRVALAVSVYSFVIAACIPGFHMDSIKEFKDVALLWDVFSVLTFSSAAALAVSMRLKHSPSVPGGRVCISLAVALLVLKALVEYGELPAAQCPLIGYLSSMCYPFCVLLSSVFVLLFFVSCRSKPHDVRAEVNDVDVLVPTLAAACIGAQLAFCGPIVVFASFPAGTQGNVWVPLTCYAVCGLLLPPLVVRILVGVVRGALREFFSLLVVFLFVLVFVYGNLYPSDYGVLFCGVYSSPENMVPTAGAVLWESLAIVMLGVALLVCRRWLLVNACKVKFALALIWVSFVLRVVVAVCNADRGGSGEASVGDRQRFPFSATGTNTVYLLLDSVVGQTFGKIAESSPEIAREFDGFTWCPNTISSGTCTYPNMPAMWAGEEYFPYEIGESKKLKDVYFEAFEKYKDAVLSLRYDFGCTRFYKVYGASMDGVARQWSEQSYARNVVNSEDGLVALKFNALLRAVPTAFRRGIYDNGRWHEKGIVRSPFSKNFDFMEDLVMNSEKVPNAGMYYHHIHSEATHSPYLTRVNGDETQLGPVESFRWSLAATAKWLKWMKENGVYDNTRIVVCSDHGIGSDDDSLMDARYTRNIARMRDIGQKRSIYFALLLVKDIGERGALRIDSSTKTVSHAAYFALGNPRFGEQVKRVCPSPVGLHMPDGWREQMGFKPQYSFEIVGDASDGNNWRPLKQEGR